MGPGEPACRATSRKKDRWGCDIRRTLDHHAFLYSGDDEFAQVMGPFLTDGLRRDEAVVAVTTRHNIDLLHDVLGSEAAQVRFVDSEHWYRKPVETIRAYEAVLTDLRTSGWEAIRVLGEVEFGHRARDQAEWERYESVLNRVFDSQPAWIVCPYDTGRVPAHIARSAARTHPYVWTRDGESPSRDYVEPEQLLQVPVRSWPALQPIVSVEVRDAEGLASLRSTLGAAFARSGLPFERAMELLAATNEVVTNALRHGGGAGIVQLGQIDGSVVCEVTDRGPGLQDPTLGYAPPDDVPSGGGMGLWLARQLCDAVLIGREPRGGLAVRLVVDLDGGR